MSSSVSNLSSLRNLNKLKLSWVKLTRVKLKLNCFFLRLNFSNSSFICLLKLVCLEFDRFLL